MLDGITDGRHLAQFTVDISAQRVAAISRQLDPQQLVYLIQRHAGIKQKLIFSNFLDSWLFGVVLILDLTDNLFQQILDGHDPGCAAVLVDDNRHVNLAHLQVR